MTHRYKALATLVLTLSVAAGYAQSATGSTDAPRKTHHRSSHAKQGPSVEDQIQALQNQMQHQAGEIQDLKQQLSDRDAQLQQAQQAAQQAQQAAQQAQQAANQQQQTVTANTTAVSNLQSSVDDLKSSTSAAVVEVKKQTAEVKKAVLNPDAVHYKGITVSPAGSFIEAATVYRSAATGGGINTPFTAIPLANSDAGQMSEFKGSGRQSRIALKADGKLSNVDMTAYYEMDWLGTGITSNNNQSNSYVVRQRQLWARAAFQNGMIVSGGQMWSLATETTHGLDNGTEILPGTIDPQYEAGFVWSRQYGFRVAKDFGNKFWIGVSAENAQALPGGSNPSNQVLGQAGAGGGLYNPTANYSYNVAPDLIAKIAAEPGWGHWELFGISRFFDNRVYPNAAAKSAAGAYNNTVVGGGVGGGFRAPLFDKKVSIGLKGLYGEGVGRYGSSTIADITFDKAGNIKPLHTFSALSTIELFPTPRWYIYLNYGGDYVGRDIQNGDTYGYGLYSTPMTGCNTEALPGGAFSPGGTGPCGGNTKDVQEFTAGYWYNFYKGPKGMFRYGLQYSHFDRNIWSGVGGPLDPTGSAVAPDDIFETSMRYYLP
jgi:type II secretory pathway pseudopilin PulG